MFLFLNRYKEDNLTDGGRHDTCIPIPPSGDNSDLFQYYILIISLGILISLFLVTTGFIYFYKKKKGIKFVTLSSCILSIVHKKRLAGWNCPWRGKKSNARV